MQTEGRPLMVSPLFCNLFSSLNFFYYIYTVIKRSKNNAIQA